MNKKIFNNIDFDIISLFIRENNKPNHGREIARKLNCNQKTTQNHLNELKKLNILKHIASGKNYNYSINTGYISSWSHLVIAEVYKSEKLFRDYFDISEIISEIKRKTNNPVLIFGSFAKGYQTEDSDLDMLVLGNSEMLIEEIQNKYSRKIHLLQIDNKDFERGVNEKKSFPTEVLRNHIICQGYEYIVNLWVEKNG